MRFHALGVQHTVTSKEYIACAFTQKVLKFCSMMTLRGHTVIHYGHQDSDVDCSEHVTVLSRDDYNRVYGEHDFRSKLFKFDQGDDAYKTFNANAIREIKARKQPGDFLLAFWGAGHQSICQGAGEGICVVEPGIGYPYGHFAEYKIFESYAMYHSFTNISRVGNCVGIDTWSKEAIIPNYFDVTDFVDEVVPAKDRGDYFLFVGRIGCAKGVDHAIRMTERLGVRLLIAGQNAEGGLKEVGLYPPPGHVEIIGHVDVEKRKTLMANAKAVVCMSMFTEPFCGVHVEAMMSGTPVITADWGAFTEFNVHGVTGFRCRTLEQMVDAGRRIHEIDPMVCRKWAFDNFSTPVVAKKYEDFFESIRPKHRVAVWMEANWAFGRYARAMKKYLPDVDVYDWANCETNRHLWIDGHWKDYQTIISNTSLLRLRETFGIDVPEEMSKRFLVISFFPKFEGTGYFQETLKNFPKNARYGGASLEICNVMRGLGVSNVKCIPFTADLEEFPVKHVVQHVKRLGIIGGPSRTNHPEYQDNKGIPMFDEICQKGGFEPVYIHGRTDDIYHDVDLLICCSKYEGAPTGIFEAAALGIPVLTRRVGCAQDVKGIAMYDTVDEALSQLKYWNENLDVLQEYTRNITREIRENWGLKTLIERHLKPTVYGLEYLMKKYGSGNYLQGCDKATLHSYAGTYESLFQSLRDKPVRILEIGVCSGGSLKVWEEYFTHPDAEFVGLDISKDNIRYTFGDRTKFLIQDATRDPPEGLFDIIIDDGSHALNDQLGALQLLASHLKPNGVYIIEDIQSMENANTILETSKNVQFELVDLRSVRGQYDDVMLVGRLSEPKVKVSIWGETIWAIGRIHRAIQKYLDGARVDVYDWSNSDSNNRLFTTDWKHYDRIVTKSDIFKLEEMFGLKLPDGILDKLVVISHCPDLDHPYFKEHIEIRDGPVYAGVSKETCEALRKKGVRDPVWVPFGADTEIFKNTHTISLDGIKRIGMICVTGHNAEYNSVKRPDMFEEICRRVDAIPVYICNRLTEDATLYDDIDLLISCSEFEAGPLGIFEAASCGVPVLTRPVGNAKYIHGVRTFNTIDEAVDIISHWSDNINALQQYTKTVVEDVRNNWNMKTLIDTHLKPITYDIHMTDVDISDIPIVYMHTGKVDRKENMTRTLEGFSNVNCYNCLYKATPGQPYHSAYNKDLINILDNQKLPFIFMEDDCSRTPWFRTKISYPPDADVVYLGNSEWAMIPGELQGTHRAVSWDREGECARVYNMLGMHGVLIISERWREILKSCCKMGIHQDVALTRFMKDFNVYALYEPIVYQDPKVGGTQTAVTFDSIPQYKGNTEYRTLDFIEIGTSDFNTEIQKADGKSGLSVEPIKHYLDSLPNVEGVTKVNAAVSNYDGFINVYSISPEIIKKYNLPEWIRGCNSVNSYHSTTLRYVLEQRLDEREVFTVDRVPVMSFFTLVKKYDIQGCRYLKIDTEGHDIIIVHSYLDCVAQGCGWFPLIPKVQFEANCLTDNAAIEGVLHRLSSVGYEVTYRDCDDIIVELR